MGFLLPTISILFITVALGSMSNSESATATVNDGGDSSFQEEQVTGTADTVSAPVLRLHDVSLASKPKTFPTCGGRLGHSRPLTDCKRNDKTNKLACCVFRPFLNHAFIAGNQAALFEIPASLALCRSPHQILVRGSHYLLSNFGAGMTVF